MDLRIIRVGDLLIEVSETPDISTYERKLSYGGTGASTVTLIKGEKNLLVDTGFENESSIEGKNEERNHQKLRMLLQLETLTPDDIDYVFLTHLHKDHTGNYELFKKAKFFMSTHEYERSFVKGEPLNDSDELMENVSVLYTPGHTQGHASLVVQTEDTIVIAGDAIVSLTYLLQGKFWCYNHDYYSDKASQESVRKICTTADYVIPGHGSIFKSVK